MKKVLHITNWYPNKWNNLDGIFIKRQFDVFSQVTKGDLVHVQVREGDKLLAFKHLRYSDNEEGYYLFTKIKANKIIELLTTFLLMYVLLKKNYRQYDILHFHIAYPLLIHYYIWKNFIKKPVIVSEHWSAYHYNFYMPKESRKLNGIKRIFKQNIPLITVSEALLRDIENFSGMEQKKYTVIPNVVDTTIFSNKKRVENNVPTFFIVNIWSKIKNPFPMLKGFSKLHKQKIPFLLKIGGYGVLVEEMKKFVNQNNLNNKIIFLGKMDKYDIANEYNSSDAYLLSSKYETFSVVCAEALCCGTPLLGQKIDAVLEYTRSKDMLIVAKDNADEWEKTLKFFLKRRNRFNRDEIAEYYQKYFSKERIAEKYEYILEEIT